MNHRQRNRRLAGCFMLVAVFALLAAFSFLNFHLMSSQTESSHSLSTVRSGETLPATMAQGFDLSLNVNGSGALAEAVEAAVKAEMEEATSAGSVEVVATAPAGQTPYLLIELIPDRFWTPLYAKANLTAQIYFAYDGDAPWPLDEPVAMDASPAVMADGEFTVVDTSWGFISRPAYTEHLAESLAEAIAAALQNDTFAPAR